MTKVCQSLSLILLVLLMASGVARAQAVPVPPAMTLPSGTGGTGAVNSVSATAPLFSGGTAANPNIILSGTVPPGNGGMGTINPPAHTVPIAEGTSTFTLLTCGANLPLVGQGAGADPLCQALNLTNGVTGTLPTANGGFGVASPTAHALPIAAGSSPFTLLTCTGFLVGTGASADPTCRLISNADLPTSGVAAGTYKNVTVTVNAQGIVTSISSGNLSSTVASLPVCNAGNIGTGILTTNCTTCTWGQTCTDAGAGGVPCPEVCTGASGIWIAG